MRLFLLSAALLFSVCFRSGKSQQNVKLSTVSSKFHLSMASDNGKALSTNQQFRFESAASKLFHNKLSAQNGEHGTHAVVTTVHVKDMESTAGETTIVLDSIVSVTFSEVERASSRNADKVVHSGESDEDNVRTVFEKLQPLDDSSSSTSNTPDVTSILSGAVSSRDLMMVLIGEGIFDEETEVMDLSFSKYDGALDERGVYGTATEIRSNRQNEGWPMFFAGVMLSFLIFSIVVVSAHVWNKEALQTQVENKGKQLSNSVLFEGDIDLEVATTASGILGLKGHHPQASKENFSPNHRNRRRRRESSPREGQTVATDAESKFGLSPMTHHSAATAATSKHPLGITSMRKLDRRAFLTPQRSKSERFGMSAYKIDKLSYT